MKLVMILVRGLQAAAIGPYGNRWVETFSLNTLAVHGVVFDRFHAVHPDPEEARRVLRTGCHRFPMPEGQSVPEVAQPDLLEALRLQGVRSHLIFDRSRGEIPGYLAGWDRVEQVADSDAAIDAGRKALQEAGESWFLLLDLAVLLPPWQIPQPIVDAYFSTATVAEDYEDEEDEEYDEDDETYDDEEEEELDEEDSEEEEVPLEPIFDPTPGPIDPTDDELFLRIRETYAAAVSNVDRLLGDLLDGLPDDVHVVVTADAGQALGEHGRIGVGQADLHAEIVNVPLILLGPNCRAGKRIECLSGSIDLAPTIAEMAGTALTGAQGMSLWPWIRGEAVPERDHLGMGIQVGTEIEWGLVSQDLTFLLNVTDVAKKAKLFIKPDDSWEVNDVSHHHLDRLENLEATLRAYVEATRQGGKAVPVAPHP